MRDCFVRSAAEYGGQVELTEELLYPAVNLNAHPELLEILEKACRATEIPLSLQNSGGGSDASILNGFGIPTVNLAAGYYNMHTTGEYAKIGEMERLAKLIVAITQVI